MAVTRVHVVGFWVERVVRRAVVLSNLLRLRLLSLSRRPPKSTE